MGQPDWSAPSDNASLTAIQAQLATVIGNTAGISSDLFSGTVSVTSTRTQLVALGALVGAVLYNPDSTNTVYIGGSAVTAADGTPLLPGAFHSWVLGVNAILYGITSGATIAVRVTYGYIQA